MKMEEARERMRREHVRSARQKKEMETNMVAAFMPGTAAKPVTPPPATIEWKDEAVRSKKKFRIKPDVNCIKNEHKYEKIDDRFKRCRDCQVLICYNPPKAKFGLLPEYLRNRPLPPTDRSGRYYSAVYVSPIFRVRRSYDGRLADAMLPDSMMYNFAVKFRKGWSITMSFHMLQWHKIIDAIDPILHTNNPVAIFNEASRAIYGRAWGDCYKHLL